MLDDSLNRRTLAVIEVPISTHENNELADRLNAYWKEKGS